MAQTTRPAEQLASSATEKCAPEKFSGPQRRLLHGGGTPGRIAHPGISTLRAIPTNVMAFEVEGTIKLIMDTQTFGSGFTKREFVVTLGDDKYPQHVKMEVVKDKTSLLDKYRVGQRVKIGFDLRGNENNGRWYVSVQAWRIHAADGSEPAESDTSSAPRSSAPPRQDRAPRPSEGRGGERPAKRDWDDDRGGGGGRKDWDDERRGGGRGEYRGGGKRGGGHEDDIDF